MTIDRLMARTHVEGECRVYDGCEAVRHCGTTRQLARVAYRLLVGPIRPGLIVVATCGRRRCIAHLALRTRPALHGAMVLDGRHGCAPAGEASPHAKLSDRQVAAMREDHASGASFKALGRAYGVSYVHASRVCRGLSRKAEARS
jgi:hypothetical protein